MPAGKSKELGTLSAIVREGCGRKQVEAGRGGTWKKGWGGAEQGRGLGLSVNYMKLERGKRALKSYSQTQAKSHCLSPFSAAIIEETGEYEEEKFTVLIVLETEKSKIRAPPPGEGLAPHSMVKSITG